MWILQVFSYLVVLIEPFVRDAMAEDDEKGEGCLDFIPNLVITTLWYIYMGVALGYKLLEPRSGVSGGGRRLKRGGSSSVFLKHKVHKVDRVYIR